MIDVLNLPAGDIFKVCPELGNMDFFGTYSKKEKILPIRETIIYVILLYTKDSFINKKPIDALNLRMRKAAKLAGLDPESPKIQKEVFELGSEHLDNLVVDYLIHQNSYDWSDRCAIDMQMEENLRIRFKPIESDKGDKDIIEASTKKFTLTEHFSKYKDTLKKLDNNIFSDHDSVKESAIKKNRTTLESLVK